MQTKVMNKYFYLVMVSLGTNLLASSASCKLPVNETYSSSKNLFTPLLAHDIHVFSTKIRQHQTRTNSPNEKPVVNEKCTQDCPDGMECVYDCSFHCMPKLDVWLNQNNGVCDSYILDSKSVDLDCLTFYFDWGDCDNSCPEFYNQDCSGRCFHESIIEYHLNDLYCSQNDQLNTIDYYPLTPDLNCYQSNDGTIYDYDNGRCECENNNYLSPSKDFILDKNLNCCDKSLIGNNIPDCSFNSLSGCDLSIYEEDGGDCFTECELNHITDCNGNCYPKDLVKDGWCHDGREANIPNFLCEEHDFDGMDCETKPDFIIDYNYIASVFEIGEVNVPSSFCNPLIEPSCYESCMKDESCQVCVGTNCDYCYIEEGCVGGAGKRKVLKFGTMIANIGTQDFKLGSPPEKSQSNELWQWSECHNHHHFRDYSSYSLHSLPCLEDQEVGFKNGWCVMDLANYPNDGISCDAKFTCDNQGISKGCSDVYSSGLPCQWIDITNISDGSYLLRVTVNPANRISELNYENNIVEVGVNINGDTAKLLSKEELESIKSQCEIISGDFDYNKVVNINDVLTLIHIVLKGKKNSDNHDYDINKDQRINILDIIYLVKIIIDQS